MEVAQALRGAVGADRAEEQLARAAAVGRATMTPAATAADATPLKKSRRDAAVLVVWDGLALKAEQADARRRREARTFMVGCATEVKCGFVFV